MISELKFAGRHVKDEKTSEQKNRARRINLLDWKGQLPKGSKKPETLKLPGAKEWRADILQEVNIVRNWHGKTQAALL